MRKTLAAALVVVTAGLAAVQGLHAAPADGKAAGTGPDFAKMCEVREAHQAGHLAFVQKRLNITAAQQDAWNRFTAKVAVANEPINTLCTSLAGQARPTTLPDKLNRAEQMMNARTAQFGAMKVAAIELYGQLTPEQQATADKLLARGPGGPGGPGGHGPGRG
jgi:protein CpxP